MSIAGIGIDMVEVRRIEHSVERFSRRFLQRVFTEGEIEYCHSMKYPARHLAARFAAKEAASKAFGTGIGKAIGWRDIDVHRKESGEPYIVLSGAGELLARERSVESVFVSLSHTGEYAVAVVILQRESSVCPAGEE
ncbi:MAG: holo-ACP synthase [Verrucomicrobia bacterium]|nr:holo-ACP synthase [Verrucomicrobiota bacterium]